MNDEPVDFSESVYEFLKDRCSNCSHLKGNHKGSVWYKNNCGRWDIKRTECIMCTACKIFEPYTLLQICEEIELRRERQIWKSIV